MKKQLFKNQKEKNDFLFWIGTLMSGVFEKGRTKLHIIKPNGDDQYCCLGIGVICTVPENKLQKDKKDKKTIIGHFPDSQKYAPKWLSEIVNSPNKSKINVLNLNDRDDKEVSHAEIGEALLKAYEQELNS